MLHNGSVVGRRRFLAATAALPAAVRCFAQDSGPPPGLRLEYAAVTPPKVPPPLALDAPARLVIEFRGSGAGKQCSLGLRTLLNGKAYLLPLAIWTGDSHSYWRAREALHLPAFRAGVGWDGTEWSLTVDGHTVFSARPASPANQSAPAEPSLPWLTYRHALSPDWTEGPLVLGSTELLSLSVTETSPVNSLPVGAVKAGGHLDGWLTKLGALGPISCALPSVGRQLTPEFVTEIDASSFEPFALRNYPDGQPGMPSIDTDFLRPDELASLRSQSEIVLPDILIASVDCVANPIAVGQLVPPPCKPDPNAVVRVMTIRGLSDATLDEAWLFAQCEIEGKGAWFAVSHLRRSLAATAFGREVLGYPTKDGNGDTLLGGNRFTSSVTRAGTSLYRADGAYGGFSTGTSLGEMLVASLRVGSGSGANPPSGEILIGPWYFQGLRKPVGREGLHASFPAPSDGDARHCWNTLGPVRAYYASVFDGAVMQRLPGAVVAGVGDLQPYYRDRCDGQLPWEDPATGGDRVASD